MDDIDTVVLIPYRNRKEHLDYFISHSWGLILKYIPNAKLVIIEQEEGHMFNSGKLLNIGVKEYYGRTKYFIRNDVDINPTDKIMNLFTKEPKKNHIVGIVNSPCTTLGGVYKIRSKDIMEMNGHPNDYWGWGCEDRALYNRAKFYKKTIDYHHLMSDKEIHKYILRFDDVNDRVNSNLSGKTMFEYDIFQRLPRDMQEKNIRQNGIHNVDYTILERTPIGDSIEIIKVRI